MVSSVRFGRIRISVEERLETSKWVNVASPVISIVLALIVGAFIFWANGVSPVTAYAAMFKGAFGSGYAISETFVKAIPLILAGLGIAMAGRMRLWNIGGEGQIYMGAFAAAGVALYLNKVVPNPGAFTYITLELLAGFLAGGIWAMITGVLKAYLNVNEIISTLMMNYIAIFWVDWLVNSPWRDPNSLGFPLSPQFPDAARLPKTPGLFFLPHGHRVHLGLVFGIAAAFIIWLIFAKTKWGFEIEAIGHNPRAARSAGMNIARNIIIVMLISGGLAGIAGMAEVTGIIHRLQRQISPGYGYTAIIVAWLARLDPWAVLLVSFLFGGLLVAGDQIQIAMKLPSAISFIIQALILFFVVGSDVLARYKIVISRR